MPTQNIDLTVVDKTLESHGKWITTANKDGYMQLYINKNVVGSPQAVPIKIKLYVGYREESIILFVHDESGLVLQNFPVYANEDCWVTTDDIEPYKCQVYGVITQFPMS
tara:strand:+ start:627 stop:953 length:327 start_codon:yes stop_codon:yes gene_type:complete